jgi:hypothetical protein
MILLMHIPVRRVAAEVVPMDLVVLADDEGNSVCIKVLGRQSNA